MKKLISVAIALAFVSPLISADEEILDDVVIDGSLCVGQDCNNGEDFQMDTIRMKENNLRIKFVDTSSSASFPGVDWQITINDSNDGGDSYFAVENVSAGDVPFRVNDGAETDSLVVGDNSFTGFGTGSPAQHLHVVDGNSPTLRLEQDGTAGFAPIVWDISTNENELTISTGGSTLLTMDTVGNMTIEGTLTAGNPPMDFPDYVFSSSYNLMPLEELGEFVSTNSHLPGIPSASEVAANGINMTELQVSLLEKLEELTLYTLQQQETIGELQRQIQTLQGQ